ncbi:MAG: VCBS repeat-containing protein [Cyclobacteriaceae bacterium]|nr:VCBS repeat-containing protein [Cyclobacteriaceae bacterium]
MLQKTVNTIISFLIILEMVACQHKPSGQEQMVQILKKVHDESKVVDNPLYPEAGLHFLDSIVNVEQNTQELMYYKYTRAKFLIAVGKEDEAIQQFDELLTGDEKSYVRVPVWKDLALAYLRQGERANCVSNHASESCILPIRGLGIHTDATGSKNAIAIYEKLLTKNPSDLESRWLLNMAYMTLGEYPKGVPAQFLIPGIEGDTTYKVKPFEDIAADSRLEVNNMSGGSIVEDFDNDGYLDIMTSGWGTEEALHYFKNNGDGTFTDLSDKIGLAGITGGLNIMQADYNNDGYADVLVLRGAWKREYGKEPNSLLKNNGDGTFTDATLESGLLSYHPTQTATWNDFNNDGWLDLFIGNETIAGGNNIYHSCELYINNHDGTFREIAKQAGCEIFSYVKGVTSGDYDHDGWKDIFISTISGKRILLKNSSQSENQILFTDVSAKAGLDSQTGNTFPTWFWDYDNDGWLDIFTCDYTYEGSLGVYLASELLHIPAGSKEKMLLYRNNHDGTFTNVADSIGLNQNVFAMGSNFGDIDNDGYLDMYLGTGNPDLKSLIPNKMFKNIGGKKFVDVTNSARVGHLQKGHGVSFADLDNDGDEDIYIEMGGIYSGDAYQNSFFLNPEQNTNNWVCLKLQGTKSNKSAIGTEVKITFKENGVSRSVYRDVNSGGSFGASPLRREIGIGQATLIDEIEIHWHGSQAVQVFKNVKPNQFYTIIEGNNQMEEIPLKTFTWSLPNKLCLPPATGS